MFAGFYLSAQLWRHPEGSRSTIMTAVMEPTAIDGECLMFWYYMEGDRVGELNVYIQTLDNSRQPAQLWTRNGDQGKHWRHGRVTLHSNTSYQVTSCSLSIAMSKQIGASFWKASPFVCFSVDFIVLYFVVCIARASIPVYNSACPLSNLKHDRLLVMIHLSDWQVIFEAVTGVGQRRDIAIDDLTILDGNCPPSG